MDLLVPLEQRVPHVEERFARVVLVVVAHLRGLVLKASDLESLFDVVGIATAAHAMLVDADGGLGVVGLVLASLLVNAVEDGVLAIHLILDVEGYIDLLPSHQLVDALARLLEERRQHLRDRVDSFKLPIRKLVHGDHHSLVFDHLLDADLVALLLLLVLFLD